MGKDKTTTEASETICEAALERYSALDDSLAELIRHASIEVRDFMLLSFICDQGSLSIEQISHALGLSHTSTQGCIDRLIMAQLICYQRVNEDPDGDHLVTGTSSGKKVTRDIHGDPK